MSQGPNRLDLSGVPQNLPLILASDSQQSRYKGVTRTRHGTWQARIHVKGSYIYLGTHVGEDEAAQAFARAKWYFEHNNTNDEESTELSNRNEVVPTIQGHGDNNDEFDAFESSDMRNTQCAPVQDQEDSARLGPSEPQLEDDEESMELSSHGEIVPTIQEKNDNNQDGGVDLSNDQDFSSLEEPAATFPCDRSSNIQKNNDIEEAAGLSHFRDLSPFEELRHYRGERYDMREILDKRNVPKDLPLIPSKPGSKTRYKGTSKLHNTISAYICYNGSQLHLGVFKTVEEAALVHARVAWYLENRGQVKEELDVNQSRDSRPSNDTTHAKQQQRDARKAPSSKSTSTGHRKTGKAAPRAANDPARDVYGGLDLSNVPQNLPLISSTTPNRKNKWKGIRRIGNKFRAYVCHNTEDLYLGTFPSEEEAARIVARADYYVRMQEGVDAELNDNRKPRAKKRPPVDESAGLATTKRIRTGSSSNNNDDNTHNNRSHHGIDEVDSNQVNENQSSTENTEEFLNYYDANALAMLLQEKGQAFRPFAAQVRKADIRGAYLVDLLSEGKESFDQFLDAIKVVDMLMRFSIWRAFDVIPRRSSSSVAASSETRHQAAHESENGSTPNVSHDNDAMPFPANHDSNAGGNSDHSSSPQAG